MALSTFSAPRGFLGVPASHQDSHFASAVELHVHKQLHARPLPLPLKPRRRPTPCVVSASVSEREAEYYSQRPPTPLLDTVNYPVHMKNLSAKELRQLADELRSDVIFHVSKTGGHLGSSLGVVELTVALHYVFNAPQDRILWDVGHQTYPHKILTGRRRDKMPAATMRAETESKYDWWFGTGHSSTTISMALGMAVGRDLKGDKNSMVAVIGGGGAMTAGQAYEAMNNAGFLRYSHSSDMIVILNDNKQVDEYARGTFSFLGSTLFEGLGLYYVGPVDGHNIDDLITTLNDVKSTKITGPVLVHVITEKGRGYPCAERAADNKYNGVANKFDPAKTQPYTNYFAEALIAEAEQDSKIVAVHAAMGGTGLNDDFLRRFPNRCFDVGIAEQHAVTFAAGLARKGLKPFCAISSSSSFLQRRYDVDLPVRFAVDSAGLVGAFDVTSMACLPVPNMVVMAPSDEAELCHMVATAAAIDDRPSCFRYPTGNAIGVPLPPNYKGTPLEIGKGRVLLEGDRVALLGYGSAVHYCLAAASLVERHGGGLKVTVADARFCKPLDHGLIRSLASSHEALITVEEGSIGGFGSHVAQFMALDCLLDGKLKWRPLVLPDRYIDHGSPADQLAEPGLTPSHIAATVFNVLGQNREALAIMAVQNA